MHGKRTDPFPTVVSISINISIEIVLCNLVIMWPVLLAEGIRLVVYADSVNQSLSMVVTSLINVLLLFSTTSWNMTHLALRLNMTELG